MAARIDWDSSLVLVDDRYEDRELRMIAMALDTGILYYVAFVDRRNTRRIISLRKAN